MANRKHNHNDNQNGGAGAPVPESAAPVESGEALTAGESTEPKTAELPVPETEPESVPETAAAAAPEAQSAPEADDVDAMIDGMAADLHLDEVKTGLRTEKKAPAEPAEKKPSAVDAVKGKIRKLSEKLAESPDADKDTEYDPNEDYIFFRPRKKRKKRPRKKSRKLSCALVLLTLVISSGVVLAVAILTVAMEIYGIKKDINERVVTIPAGSTTTSIAEQLKKENIIQLPQFFRLISRMNGKDGSYIAGEHILSPSMSYQTMIDELCENHAEEREYMTVTFPEGISLLEAATILEKNEICKADDFIFYFNAGGFGFNFEKYLPETNAMKFYQREGYCFPDTYEFYVEEDPQIVAQKIYANFNSKITAGEYAKMEELGMTLDEVITLASIVQKEAANVEEMRMIAGIFHNRLINKAVFSKLQSDPTRKYAEDVIHPNLPVRNEMMEDAYNTYVGTGLPPGAIGNPGKAAIESVLYPEESSYYYFYANIDTKKTYYAETYEEHLANIAKVKQEQEEAAAAAEGN